MSILSIGDSIGIIAPSSGFGLNDSISPACEMLQQMGFQIVLADNLQSSYRYMAGNDQERAAATNSMIADSSIKALLCLRGGAGSTRILDYLDFSLLQKNPKPIIGLSDSTALQNAAFSLTENPSLTGFLPLYDTHDDKVNSFMVQELHSALLDNDHNLISGNCLSSGSVSGKIVGGCLSTFTLLCGTIYFPDLTNKILLLEDVGEKTYKIDLMFNQLKQQPNFNKIKGIILGSFTNCEIKDNFDGGIADCIADFTKDLNIPIITDFAYGHIPQRHILPLGITVNMTASSEGCQIQW